MKDTERNKLLSHFTVEQSPDAILWLDSDGVISRANKAAYHLFGYSLDELIGKKIFDLNLDEEDIFFEKEWENLKSKPGKYLEKHLHKKDGTKMFVEISTCGIKLENKEYTSCFIRDISERKQNEESLKLALVEIKHLIHRLEHENIYLREEINLTHNFEEIIYKSESLKNVLHKVEQVASTDAPVLILGETGTGKELIARAIHSISNRGAKALLKVDCASLPPNIIESELFGHEKGAFTGAYTQKLGRFELADNGTIFLDEIGELPFHLQAKLLCVLQDGKFERVGGSKMIEVDVRIITATNRNIVKEVQEGKFRDDLFYRINTFPIEIAPLRQRKEDIPVLVQHFIQKYNARFGKQITTIPQKTMDILLDYHWPGNVRGLENIIQRAIIVSRGDKLELGDSIPLKKSHPTNDDLITFEEMERNYIKKVIETASWRISGEQGAAKILGMKPTTLESKMKKLGITRSN